MNSTRVVHNGSMRLAFDDVGNARGQRGLPKLCQMPVLSASPILTTHDSRRTAHHSLIGPWL